MTARNWLPDDSKVLVVAGNLDARKEAEEQHQYVCQNRRSFQPSKWIAFYANGQIDQSTFEQATTEVEVQAARLAAKEAQIKEAELRLKQAERRLALAVQVSSSQTVR